MSEEDHARQPGFSPLDRLLLNNVHLDVHGVRRDFRDAIEKSQTALLNRFTLQLDRMEAKIDALTPVPGGDANTEALAAAAKAAGTAVTDAEKALSEGKPTT